MDIQWFTRRRLSASPLSFKKFGLAAVGFIALAGGLEAQQSRAPYDTPSVLLEPDSPPFQGLFDFNADGFIDLVGYRIRSDAKDLDARVWQNDGNGAMTEVFSASGIPSAGSTSALQTAIATGDFNGDTFDDFVLAVDRGHSTYYSDGTGQFTRVTGAESLRIVRIAAADFDGDGIDDRLFILRELSQLRVLIYWSGGGSLNYLVPGPYIFPDVLIVETDGDALPDFALSAGLTNQLFSIESGVITPGVLLTTEATSASQTKWAVGDVDGDGSDDFVAFGHKNSDGYGVDVHFQAAPQVWTRGPWAVGGPATGLADIDGDGDLDGVCCGGGTGRPPTPTFPMLDFGSKFEIALNDGSGVFAPSFNFDGFGSTMLAGVADLDMDGDADLVAGACIYYTSSPLTESPFRFPGGSEYYLSDIDRDGDLDHRRATSNPFSKFTHYLNNGNGDFVQVDIPAPQAPAGLQFKSAKPGEFTGDNADDWLAFAYDNSNQFVRMYLLRNSGSGQFVNAGPASDVGVSFTIEGNLKSFFIGDADGDGDNDLFTRTNNGTPRQSRLFLNDGSGYLTLEQELSMKVEALADFDGDGRVDIMGSRQDATTGNVSEMWMGLGSSATNGPVFAPIVNALGAVAPDVFYHHIDVRDFNGDGKPDVSFIDFDDVPHLFFNTTETVGSCSFAETDILDGLIIDGTFARVIGLDVNADGWMDLVMGPTTAAPNIGMILEAIGPLPALPTAANYKPMTRQMIPDFDAGDINGDGLAELFSNSSHIRNRALSAEQGGYREQYGTGFPGPGDVVPTVGAIGPFRYGENAKLILTGAEGGAIAFLSAGLVQSAFVHPANPVLTAYAYPWLLFKRIPIGGEPGVPGAGYKEIPYVVSSVPAGVPIYYQYWMLDADLNLSHTNGLTLTHVE